jgi:ankyrin repeat protein
MSSNRFRWVFCQLDTLRRCMPSSIRQSLDGLPDTLDDTYERALQGIHKERRQHAHRLFQCLLTAIRPPRVQELAEMFAIDFGSNAVMEGWRPQNPEEAILSTCSTLITVTGEEGSRVVQFSHFSVKEYLTSDRLCNSVNGNIRHYHITLDAAHTILARACLTVLLQLHEGTDKKHLAKFPLALYAAQHWVDHAKYELVASQIRGAMEQLFNPSKSYLVAWARLHDVDRDSVRLPVGVLPSWPRPTALYYAVLCGFSELAEHLIVAHAEDVNVKCGFYGSPLHAALYKGHLDAARVLLEYGADKNLENPDGKTPLVTAYDRGNLEGMRLLLRYGANGAVPYSPFGLLLHGASYRGQAEVTRLLLQYNSDVNARGVGNLTPLDRASMQGHANVAQLLLECGAEVNAQTMAQDTPLHRASRNGHLEVVQTLLRHRADVHIRGQGDWTPLQVARSRGHIEVVRLLIERGAERE